MAGLIPAIHVLLCGNEDVDARDKPGHDEFAATLASQREFVGAAPVFPFRLFEA